MKTHIYPLPLTINLFKKTKREKCTNFINHCETCLESNCERQPRKVPLSGALIAKRSFDHNFIDLFSIREGKFPTVPDSLTNLSQTYAMISKERLLY